MREFRLDFTDFGDDFFVKLLVLKADIVYTHALNELDLVGIWLDDAYRRLDIESDAYLRAVAKQSDSFGDIPARFGVNDDSHGTSRDPVGHDFFGSIDHQVEFVVQIFPFGHAFVFMDDLLETVVSLLVRPGGIRHELSVTDVYLHGLGEAFDEPDFVREFSKVFGQDGRDDFY